VDRSVVKSLSAGQTEQAAVCWRCGEHGPPCVFCRRCGVALVNQCPECAAPFAREVEFCGRCGRSRSSAPLSASSSAEALNLSNARTVAAMTLLSAQQRVTRSSAALLVVSILWFMNVYSTDTRIALLTSYVVLFGAVPLLVMFFWILDRYGAQIAAEWSAFRALYSTAYIFPRLVLIMLGALLTILSIGIAASSVPPNHKVTPMFIALTGLVFVGPWWPIWRRIRLVFWGYFAILLVSSVLYSLIMVLHSLYHA
jgi:hypothetical protein